MACISLISNASATASSELVQITRSKVDGRPAGADSRLVVWRLRLEAPALEDVGP